MEHKSSLLPGPPVNIGRQHIYRERLTDDCSYVATLIVSYAFCDVERLSATDWRFHVDLHLHLEDKLYTVTRGSFALPYAQRWVVHP